MKRIISFLCILIIIQGLNQILAQCTPASADHCKEANVLYSLQDLDGYNCKTADYLNPTGCTPLCPSGSKS